METDASGDQYAETARALKSEPSVEATMEHATESAVKLIPGCDHAGITMKLGRGKVQTLAPSDDVVIVADQIQYDTGQGPCLQAIEDDGVIVSRDLRTEDRWPLWTEKVLELTQIRSALALRLYIDGDAFGALNLFSDSTDGFCLDDRPTAMALAAHVSVAVAAATDHEQLEAALEHRTVIGQAQGLLMGSLKIDEATAFAAMKRASQARNIKLHVIASQIVHEGISPELFG